MHEQKCTVNELFIEQYFDGELGYKESSEIAAHIKQCNHCRDIYNEYKSVREFVQQLNKNDKLTQFEHDALVAFVDKNAVPWGIRYVRKLWRIIDSHGFSVGFFTASILLFAAVFVWQMNTIDAQYDIIMHDIDVASSNTLPPEFKGHQSISDMHHKLLSPDSLVVKRILKNMNKVDGRFVTLGNRQAVALSLKDKKGAGTLLVSDESEKVKNLFSHSACIGSECRIRSRKVNGRNTLYWNRGSQDYIFVGDSDSMRNKMVHLVSY